ncbi:uncharacterized protein J3R85_001480, partial [Psidium guajava]
RESSSGPTCPSWWAIPPRALARGCAWRERKFEDIEVPSSKSVRSQS